MKLTPPQIGILASIIEGSILLNPISPEKKDSPLIGKEKWEQCVEEWVNTHPELRLSYQELQEKHLFIYEMLVEYYSRKE